MNEVEKDRTYSLDLKHSRLTALKEKQQKYTQTIAAYDEKIRKHSH